MMPIDAIRHANVRAFLKMLRHGEGTTDADGYRRMFGGALFDSYDDHPRQVQTARLRNGGELKSSAAGAYQFLSRTWDGLVKQYNFADFSPTNQDLGAVGLIIGRKAIDDVIAGRFDVAVAKCAKEWASLPGSPYGQPTVKLADIRDIYVQAGGTFEAAPTSIKEKPMLPFIVAALPALFDAVPKLIKVFSDDGVTVPQRNEAAVSVAIDVAKAALGVPNEQAMADALRTDPNAAAAVRAAIDASWAQITEAGGGGIDGARKHNATLAAAGTSSLQSPAFLISALLLVMPFMLLVDVFFVHSDAYANEMRTQIITGVLMVIGIVGGYWLGSSFGSAKKDDARMINN